MVVSPHRHSTEAEPSLVPRRPFGNTGLRVSEVGIGCQSFAGGLFRPVDAKSTREILRQAFDQGVNFFDLCQSYGQLNTERLIGDLFRRERDRIVLAVKVGETYPGTLVPLAQARYVLKPLRRVLAPIKTRLHKLMYAKTRFSYSREHITKAVEDNLAALQTDYLDVVQVHCPPREVIERGEFIGVLQSLRAQGKIRHFGVYCMDVDDALLVLEHSEIASIQVPFNLMNQRAADVLFPEARRRNVAIIAKQAFAHGVLTDAVQPLKAEFMTPTTSGLRKAVEVSKDFRFLAAAGRTMAQAALRFVLAFPEVSVVISGIGTLAELDEDMGYRHAPALTETELGRARAYKSPLALGY
jgi:aryl-alcohol dehydrogenase-like predicted oxidoreductase